MNKYRYLISKPATAFLFIKNRGSKVFFYLLAMSLFLLLPTIIINFTQKELLTPDIEEVMSALYQDDQSYSIIDGTLISNIDEPSYKTIGYYQYILGESEILLPGIIFNFQEQGIYVDIFANQYAYITYESLGITNIDFTNKTDVFEISNKLVNYTNDRLIFRLTTIFINYLSIFFETLITAVFFAFLSRFFAPVRIKFSLRFKTSVYLMTIYAAITLVSYLTSISVLSYLALIMTYVYHIIAYRSIKVIERKSTHETK